MHQITSLKMSLHTNIQDKCHIFPLAKHHRLHFSTSYYKASACFDLIHVDVWGPYRKPTYDKKYYFVTIVDDCSRYIWIYLIQSKSEVVIVLKKIVSH